ncbi:MAG: hypothetical protein EXR51_05885 [Dehalococcoidia bacterium]|nr:hypothetical protein [Dehalococcoidia bacterium]
MKASRPVWRLLSVLFLGLTLVVLPAAPKAEGYVAPPERPLMKKSVSETAIPSGLIHRWSGEGNAVDSVGGAHGTLGAATASMW